MLIFLGHPHLFNKTIELDIGQRLYKAISDLLLNRDIRKFDSLDSYLIADVVVLNINLLYLRVEDWVIPQCYRSLIIAFQWDNDSFGWLSPPRSLSRSWYIVWTHIFFWKTLIRVCYWLSWRKSSLVSNNWSYVTSFTVMVSAIYSTSVYDKVTVGCLFKHKLTRPLFSIKMNHNIDSRLSLLSAQFKSKYLLMRNLS